MSSVPCEQIWGILDGRLRHLLSMMSDCPLAFHHKKGEYICSGFFFFFFFLIGGYFCICGACGAIRLYLGASLCIYIFWLMMYFFFVWVVHDGGRYIDDICFLFHIIY